VVDVSYTCLKLLTSRYLSVTWLCPTADGTRFKGFHHKIFFYSRYSHFVPYDIPFHIILPLSLLVMSSI